MAGRGWAVLLLLTCSCAPPRAGKSSERSAVLSANGDDDEDDDALLDTTYGAFDPLLGAQLDWEEGDTQAHYSQVAGQPPRADYVVQFFGPVDQACRDLVAHSGARTIGYFPHNALVVAASQAQIDALERAPGVRAAVPMPPVLRVHPSLFAALPGSQERLEDGPVHLNVQKPVEVLVEVDEPVHVALIDEALARTSGQVLHHAWEKIAPEQVRSVHVRLDALGLGRLSRMAEVVAIAPVPTWTLLNDRSSGLLQSGVSGQRSLQARGLNGNGQIAAVADSGLDGKSCYFAARGKVVAYQNFNGTGKAQGDERGHGTHVAGTLAGEAKSARDCGVAPKAQLVVQKVVVDGDKVSLGGNLGLLFYDAMTQGAWVHVNSWGITDGAYGPALRAVDLFADQHPNFVVVAASGNNGEGGLGTVHAPASAKNVLAVGAYEGERPNRVAWFSAQGPTKDGRIKPTLLAPGVNIQSARFHSRCKTQVMSGTSMAAPMVAGGVLLLRQYFMEGRHPDGHVDAGRSRVPSAALLRAVLLAGADPISEPAFLLPPPQWWQQGFGRARLDRSLGVDGSGRDLFVVDADVALDTGQTWQACFDVAADSPLDVALAWSDPPPRREGVAQSLVQNLDLQLVDALGRPRLGNAELLGEPVESMADDRNVEEVIRVAAMPAGPTCLRVVATHAPVRAQTFAIALLAKRLSPVSTEVLR